jgi:hypothetical protein
MTDEVMSPLRRRMIEDMTIRKLAPKTQQLRWRPPSLVRPLIARAARRATRRPLLEYLRSP